MFQYPYGDTQQLNLDWLMEQWQETKASIDGSLQGEIDRVEAAITDLLTARDQAVAAKTAAETAATSASGYASTASTAASTATAQATAAAGSAALAGSKASDAQTAETNAALQATAAANSAAAAAVSKTNAGNSETAAAASSSSAAGNALYAEGMANGTQNGTPVASGSPYYENNAAYWAGEAQNYDNDAALAAYYSEAMAKGTMNGTPVTSGEPGYEDNAEYYKDQAAAQAAAAAASAASADGTNAQKMIAAPEEATSTAAAAHAAGTYFRYNSKLYKATQDIPLGGTITPNTNCVEDTVCAELTAQSEQIDYVSEKSNVITPDAYITQRAFLQDISASNNVREITIAQGKITFKVKGSYRHGFIISKLINGTVKDIAGEIADFSPTYDMLSDIQIISGCDLIRFYAIQTTTASTPREFVKVVFYHYENNVITYIGMESLVPSINGYNIKKFTIPENATHYIIFAHQTASNSTTTTAIINFSKEDTSGLALALSN